MRVIDCIQGSEAWHQVRRGIPTASNFRRIVTPVKGELSKSCTEYACELVADSLGVRTEPPPSYWMEWGTENEPHARRAYEQLHDCIVTEVGFLMPDDTNAFGGSPDGLCLDDGGILETKCPKPETLIKWHADGVCPAEFKPQIQGLLLISGCEYCDLFCWHPALNPFEIRVRADYEYQFRLADALLLFVDELNRIKSKVFAVANTTWAESATEDLE
jgi:hypothetical protein